MTMLSDRPPTYLIVFAFALAAFLGITIARDLFVARNNSLGETPGLQTSSASKASSTEVQTPGSAENVSPLPVTKPSIESSNDRPRDTPISPTQQLVEQTASIIGTDKQMSAQPAEINLFPQPALRSKGGRSPKSDSRKEPEAKSIGLLRNPQESEVRGSLRPDEQALPTGSLRRDEQTLPTGSLRADEGVLLAGSLR